MKITLTNEREREMNEQQIKDAFTEVFQTAEVNKDEVIRIFNLIAEQYL